VGEPVVELERRIAALRTALRMAALAGEKEQARALRAELRAAERAWDDLLAEDEAGAGAERPAGTAESPAGTGEGARVTERPGALMPLREQVHEALSLLTVPAAPRLLAAVHEAFFASSFPTARVTSLKRDEERSFRLAPYARPYYICAALAADRLAPSRGLLAVSTWPAERRMIGSLSPRVDFLVSAIRVADAIGRLPAGSLPADRLLRRFAANIPGVPVHSATVDLRMVVQAAQAELEVHQAADSRVRRAAARRVRELDDVQQLFGARFGEERVSG